MNKITEAKLRKLIREISIEENHCTVSVDGLKGQKIL